MAEILIQTDSALHKAVLHILHYYAIFHYPLKADEINAYCPLSCTYSEIENATSELFSEGSIYAYNGFYSVQNNIIKLVERRLKGNAVAARKKEGANKAGRLISKFPFVQFVGISGSISKNYAEKDSDYDFFIITSKNRLWICRTLLHLFKKCTFIVGRQNNFCMNYFIDTSKLTLEEKNQYTAIELVSLIPVGNPDFYNKLIVENSWVYKFLPNYFAPYQLNEKNDSESIFKLLFEFIFNSLSPEWLNSKLMEFTDKRWRKKWNNRNFPAEDYELAFKTRINISKNHPANHQKKVLAHLSNIKFQRENI